MRNTMKMTLAALASLALIPAAATAAYQVGSPIPGTVKTTTYSSSGAFHGAVDIASGQCGYWGADTGVVGSLSWDITIRNTNVLCYGSGIPTSYNEARHIFANGFSFRIWHFIKTADSVDKTCDRCMIGNEGGTTTSLGIPHIHLQYDINGTNSTAWYSSYTVQGEFLDRGEIVGNVG
jgi:hypothetical protein